MNRFSVECRASIDGNRLVGHAAVFNQVAEIGNYYETIAPGAFEGALEDVRALINHDPSALIGRQSSGTLRLAVDSEGLAFEVDLPDTQPARDLRALVERGDLSGASFGFQPGEQKWSKAPDGRALRTHVRFKRVFDVSPVTFPAFEGAGVRLRSLVFEPLDQRTQLIRARFTALGGDRLGTDTTTPPGEGGATGG